MSCKLYGFDFNMCLKKVGLYEKNMITTVTNAVVWELLAIAVTLL